MFTLHPQLAQDCVDLGAFPLCRLLLMNDAQYPWCILVPQREGLRELYELSAEDHEQLQRESLHLARFMAHGFDADKMNVAALGNLVPQLHIHHLVRYKDDPAWPKPVWGVLPARPYDAESLAVMRARLTPVLTSLSKENY